MMYCPPIRRSRGQDVESEFERKGGRVLSKHPMVVVVVVGVVVTALMHS